jgi:uncharacterized protein
VKPTQRHPLPDVLRALALLGVVVVNAAGYGVAPTGPVLGRATPPDDALAWALQGVQAWLLQGKAYPVLAFLFGWGVVQAMKDRSPAALGRAGQRLWRLLPLGLLHGTVVYFGDILTLYALCGFMVIRAVHAPWLALRRRIKVMGAWALGLSLLMTALGALVPAPGAEEPGFAAVTNWSELVELNVLAFVSVSLPSMVVSAPVVALCMLAGIAAARLRLLTHVRWQGWRKRFVGRWLLPSLLLNLLYAVATVMNANDPDHATLWLDSATPLFGLPTAAVLVLAFAQAWSEGKMAWAAKLAPLGQRSLSLYLACSLLCVLFLSGAGLGWQPGTLGVTGLSLGLWLLAAAAAASSTRRWPLEAWMGRRV